MKKFYKNNMTALAFLFFLLIVWQLGAMKVDAAYILPTPVQIMQRLWELREVLFTVHLPATMRVTFIGLAISLVFGLESFLAKSTVSGCDCITDDPDHCDCPVVCSLVWLWYLE